MCAFACIWQRAGDGALSLTCMKCACLFWCRFWVLMFLCIKNLADLHYILLLWNLKVQARTFFWPCFIPNRLTDLSFEISNDRHSRCDWLYVRMYSRMHICTYYWCMHVFTVTYWFPHLQKKKMKLHSAQNVPGAPSDYPIFEPSPTSHPSAPMAGIYHEHKLCLSATRSSAKSPRVQPRWHKNWKFFLSDNSVLMSAISWTLMTCLSLAKAFS